MGSEDYDSRLAAIEIRLTKIEALLSKPAVQAHAPVPPRTPVSPAASHENAWHVPAASPISPVRKREESSLIGNILGWGGAIALVLAASYLIRLAIDSGWLTPLRQIAFAAISGLILVGAGFVLRRRDRQYAGLLPAAGIAILFLAIYGGHLYHQIIGVKEAGVAIIIVCAISLWLCRAFESDLYALFAVAGSYSAPFLLSGIAGSLTDLAIYFSAWGAVFCVFAIWQGRRLIYLLALYLALIGFDQIWRGHQPDEWIAVFAFQTVQFALFGLATIVFSIRRQEPLDVQDALPHLPPLLIFYFLQYSLLSDKLPVFAPWIAVGSLVAIAALYGIARASLQRPLPGGELLLWCYAALVLFHAGYLESVPREWGPWAAFFIVPIIAIFAARGQGRLDTRWPIWVVIAIVFAENYLRIIFSTDIQAVPARQLLAVVYALLLYVGYWFCLRQEAFNRIKVPLLYMGHVSAMAAALHIIDEPIIESAAWGLLAIGCLALSLRLNDRLLGQSSLAVFGATAGKVLLFDLSGASPVARIIGLVVLGLTFYFGGLLYQRILGENARRPEQA